jgi:hypothetical protein
MNAKKYECKYEEEHNPVLVVMGFEIAYIRRLKIAHPRTAFHVCEAGVGVVMRMYPSVMQ